MVSRGLYAWIFGGFVACAACRSTPVANDAAAAGSGTVAMQPAAQSGTQASSSTAQMMGAAQNNASAGKAGAISAPSTNTSPISHAGATSASGAGGVTTTPSAAGQSAQASGAAGTATAGAGGMVATVPSGPRELTLLDHEWFSGPMLGYDTQFMDRPFDLGPGPFEEVSVTFQLESPCFPFDKWTQSPPPDGEMFPAKCDRFDRLMYFEVDPAADAMAPPGLQVLRAITPYGGPLEKSADITDFANTHPGMHSLRSFVGTWVDDQGQISGSDGGYFVSVRIHVKPGMPAQRALLVRSLFSGWVGVDTMLVELPFTLPEGTTRAQLVYLVTGHGGAMDPSSACIGAADEFCKRTHHLTVDGAELTPSGFTRPGFVPWRDDCGKLCTMAQGHPMMGAYCKENPNRMASSVTAPRANWCPGDAVAPIVAELPASQANAGTHQARFAIDDIYPEGRWQVALAVYAYGD